MEKEVEERMEGCEGRQEGERMMLRVLEGDIQDIGSGVWWHGVMGMGYCEGLFPASDD